MSRIGCWELAHEQTHSSEDVYGERRDNEQCKLRVVGMAHMQCCEHSFLSLCTADEYASNANPLVWYFLNGAFGMFDQSCSPHSCASALSWHSPSKPASSLVWLIANTQTRPANAVLRQFSKQDFMPPCSIKEIAQTAPKHFQHIHSLCSKF